MASEDPNFMAEADWMDENGEISAQQQDPFSARKADSRFACNICLDPVSEPVVTQCGHLYCWPCLYRWLEPGIRPEEAFWNSNTPAVMAGVERPINESRRCCPVCKAPCSVSTLVPIYVRNEPTTPVASRKRGEEKENDECETTGDSVRNDQSENLRSESATTAEDQRHTTSPPEEQEMPSRNDSPPEQQLRQRLRFRSRDSEISYESIPSRPSASSPSTRSNTSSSAAAAAANNNQSSTAIAHRQQAFRTPLSPNPHNRASLSHGLLLLFQQALNGASSSDGLRDEDIPSLHRRDEASQGRVERPGRPQDDHSTEFLSRLLLILGSFVILCLLIF